MSSLGYVRESGILSGFSIGICCPRFERFVAGTADGTIVRTDHQRKVPEVIGIENITSIVKQCTLTYISKHHTFVTCPIVTITELSSQTPVALSYVPSKNFLNSSSTDYKIAMVSLNNKPEFGHISQMIEISLIEIFSSVVYK